MVWRCDHRIMWRIFEENVQKFDGTWKPSCPSAEENIYQQVIHSFICPTLEFLIIHNSGDISKQTITYKIPCIQVKVQEGPKLIYPESAWTISRCKGWNVNCAHLLKFYFWRRIPRHSIFLWQSRLIEVLSWSFWIHFTRTCQKFHWQTAWKIEEIWSHS